VVTGPPMFLSRLLGRPVRSSNGVRVGRVVDMTVLYDIPHPNVHRLGVGRGRRIRYLLPGRMVQTYSDEELSLPVDRMGLSAYVTAPDPNLEDRELRLAWDVLDTQVVDLVGRRLSRVSDVFLVPGSYGELEVAAVDVGAGSLLRRMGFRRLGDRFRPVAVDWAELHLTSRRGHLAQLATADTALHRLDASELAELLPRLSADSAVDVVRSTHPAHSAAALHASHPEIRRRLLQLLTQQEVQRLVDAASPTLARVLTELHAIPTPSRRYLRTSGWRVRRPPKAPPEASPPAGDGERS
jgi:sporulation protein YlmC with PRC-barrel domain